jgi:uncharacterized membrane protein YedE/YeeE
VLNAYLVSLVGGALIGLSATWYWRLTGGVAGISGLLRGTLHTSGGRGDRLAFLGGLVVAGVVATLSGVAPVTTFDRPLGLMLLAGVLVGFGTRVGGGCTSGHGVCGLSRLSLRSLVATLTFIATGAATVFALGHLPAVASR